MKRAMVACILLATFAITPAARAESVQGVFRVHIGVVLLSPRSENIDAVNCAISVIHNPTGYVYQVTKSADALKLSAGQFVCDMDVVYSWPHADSGMPVYPTITVTGTGQSNTKTTSVSTEPAIPLPANGATTDLRYSIRF